MFQKLSLLVFVIALVSCQQAALPEKKVNTDGEVALISTCMNEQQQAWNQGNMEKFMVHYWQHDSLTFIGSRGLTKGWQQTLDNYKKSYPDKAAMGALTCTNYRIDVLDDSSAYVIGKWQLDRVADTLAGHYTLLWKKISGKWCIVADHSS